jgi:hypothetical protein
VAPRIGAWGKYATLYRLPQPGGLALFKRVKIIEAFQEKQVGDLLDHLQWVRDPASPEAIPDGVDLVADIASKHFCRCAEFGDVESEAKIQQ